MAKLIKNVRYVGVVGYILNMRDVCQNENDFKFNGGGAILLDFLEIFGFFGLGWSTIATLSHYARACAGTYVYA